MKHRKRHIPRAVVKALDVAAETIDRAKADEVSSKQPRFAVDQSNMQALFYQIYGWGKELIFNEPPYIPDSRARDRWLAQVVKKEPYLLGVLQSCVSIDANRGFTVTGGKIQVKRVLEILHSFQAAPDQFGWRPSLGVLARSFYQSDLGGIVELGRVDMGNDSVGPLARMYTVDSTKCSLTGNSLTPMQYAPGISRGGTGYWTNDYYFRIASFLDTEERASGLGLCAVSRCIEMAKIAVSIFEHYKEKLGSKAPKGILTINGGGITQAQWLSSLEQSKAELSQLMREYYTGVQTLVADRGSSIDIELIPLSNLPDQFDLKGTMDIILAAYALAFGRDIREFWHVDGGAFGGGQETQQQKRKATSKGELDFWLNLQENIQRELPDTIEFEVEQRDIDGDISETALKKAKWDIVDSMVKSANANGEVTFTHDQMMELAVSEKVVPEDWTLPDEDVEVSDTDDMDVDAMLTKERVRAAMVKYPDDDIVTWSENTGKFRVLRRAGAERRFMMRNAKAGDAVLNFSDSGSANDILKSLEAILRKSYSTKKDSPVTLGPEYGAVLGDTKLCSCGDSSIPTNIKINCAGFPGEFGIEQSLLTRANVPKLIQRQREQSKARYISAGNFEVIRQEYWEVVFGAVSDYLESTGPSTSYKSAMKRGVVEAFQAAAETAYTDGGAELPLDEDTQAWVDIQVNSELANVDTLFASLALLRKEDDTNAINEGVARADGYANTLNGIYNQARIYGLGNQMLTFTGTDGERSCAACQQYKGQSHRASWWLAHDAVPPTGGALDCAAGGRCLHVLEDKQGNQVTV